MQLSRDAAIDIDQRYAFDAFKTFLHDVVGEIAKLLHRAIHVRPALQHHPCDGIVIRPGSIQRRFLSFIGIARYPVQTIGDQQQRTIHVRANRKLKIDRGPASLGTRCDFLKSLKAFQNIFLFINDFALNLCRGGAGPDGADLYDRLANIRRQLNGDRRQRQNAEHHRHHHDRNNGDRAFNREADRVHRLAPRSLWRDVLTGAQAFIAAHDNLVADIKTGQDFNQIG